MTHRWNLGITTPGQSGTGSNNNNRVLHTFKISRTGDSPSDAVSCYNQDTLFLDGKVLTCLQGIQVAH